MRIFATIVATVGTVMLTITLFAAGYFVCAFPLTTQMLSQAVSEYEQSPYELDDLSALAVAGRNLTVDDRAGASAQEARTAFDLQLMASASQSAERAFGGSVNGIDMADKDKRQKWRDLLSQLGASTAEEAFAAENADETAAKMAEISNSFALDSAAFSHLDDCNYVINSLMVFVRICAIAAAVCFLLLLVTRRWHALGIMMTLSPIILFVVFGAFAAWCFVDFSSFFGAFHGVLFPQGNWTFDADSLLICMYPTGFWMGMGIIWLTTTVLAAIIALFIGRSFSHIGR